jgi:hypothetical protein
MVVVQQRPYPLHNCFILNTQNSFFFKLKKRNLNSVYIMYIHIPCVKKMMLHFGGVDKRIACFHVEFCAIKWTMSSWVSN